MGRVSGKVALISGGARGMGAAFARALVEEGAKVVIGDLLDHEGMMFAEELGEDCVFVHLDVREYAEWESAVQTAVSSFGRLDVLINNAGLVKSARFDEHTIEDWKIVIDVNLTGSFFGMRAAVEELKRSGRGSIINISSDAGLQGYEAITGYNASKFGLRGLTKSAALDLGRYNVRVNTVHPGLIRTPMLAGMEFPQDHVALHRLGEMEELGKLILFLASDDSSFSTGAEFIADGGESAGLAHRQPAEAG
ncbi:SDR family oxidoreductase [Arthrobacter sp. W4I7]|uniref:SDR family oxidoreductase n=1 Tax=Arthrobacter sp. W4I7 TaxID=3042296 RepID=UPI002783681A|nr:SDR family oxidoreductase [Arthrobacter sp. W4I7]MDQ0691306.1 3alpha(or 20beta)-hydroxysteroid dehydrogenase [Arthrobacter sp. W4I7]